MVIASSYLQQQPCWAHRCIAQNKSSVLAGMPLACNVHMELTTNNLGRWIQEDFDYVVSAMGKNGPEQLRQDSDRFGASIQQQGGRLIRNILQELSLTTRKN